MSRYIFVCLRKTIDSYSVLAYITYMSDELLTVEQAAEKLQLSIPTIRRMLRDGKLLGRKLGPRQWRVPALAIRQFVDAAMTEKPVEPKGE
jgi:excisionase family DNA binding protein